MAPHPHTPSAPYTPSRRILARYARVLVRFALGKGRGVRRGEVVYLSGGEETKPLFLEVRNEILRAGAHVIANYTPAPWRHHRPSRDFYELAAPHHLAWFPERYLRGLVDEMDHSIALLGDHDPRELEGVHPKKIMRRQQALHPFMEWRRQKEIEGKFSWTLALYGTEGHAREAGMELPAYWRQIVRACYLDHDDPVAAWRRVTRTLEKTRAALNRLAPLVRHYHVEGPDANLIIPQGEARQWLGGSGANIPSFELFTSPDWRGVEGWMRFNQPLYHYGALIEGIALTLRNGRVVHACARKNEHLLKEMLRSKNADKVGEFSLTDKRLSRITRFMGNTLYDENIGGPHGNTHIALGSAYRDAYAGKDVARLKEQDWEQLGFNTSPVHTDIISTAPRRVTAHLHDGAARVIYDKGMFTL